MIILQFCYSCSPISSSVLINGSKSNIIKTHKEMKIFDIYTCGLDGWINSYNIESATPVFLPIDEWKHKKKYTTVKTLHVFSVIT